MKTHTDVVEDRHRGATSPWMTAAQAALYLGLPSIRALYQAIRRGQIPARRLGRRLRFLRQDLDATLGR